MSCDKVQRSAEKVISVCCSKQATGDNQMVVDEFVGLTYFVKHLYPVFTACGFFDVNRTVLPSFMSGLASYTIIVIQFKN